MHTQLLSQTGQMIELCCEYLSVWYIWLYVFVMSRTRFRLNPHSIVSWMWRKSLLKVAAESDVQVTAAGLDPTTTHRYIYKQAIKTKRWNNSLLVQILHNHSEIDSLHKKWNCSLRICLVKVNKSAVFSVFVYV